MFNHVERSIILFCLLSFGSLSFLSYVFLVKPLTYTLLRQWVAHWCWQIKILKEPKKGVKILRQTFKIFWLKLLIYLKKTFLFGVEKIIKPAKQNKENSRQTVKQINNQSKGRKTIQQFIVIRLYQRSTSNTLNYMQGFHQLTLNSFAKTMKVEKPIFTQVAHPKWVLQLNHNFFHKHKDHPYTWVLILTPL